MSRPTLTITAGLQAGQVLQRGRGGARARLVGTCTCDGLLTATISWRGRILRGWTRRRIGRVRDGRLAGVIAGLPPGGPYRIELRCATALATIAPVFAGDVWLLAGQSNMEGIGDLAGAPEPHPLVRVRRMHGGWELAREPICHLPESTDVVHNPPGVELAAALHLRHRRSKGVGPGLAFARERFRATGVPQGLIPVAHGGTTLAQWDPRLAAQGGASLYGSLLAAVRSTGQPLAGLLWYQGESDANATAHAAYGRRTARLVAALRRDLRQPRLPVAAVQLGRWSAGGDGAHAWWDAVREQQRRLPLVVPRLAVVAAADLPLDDTIHIGADGQAELGRRLARAMANLHGEGEAPEPQVAAVRRLLPRGPGSRTEVVELRIRHAVGALRTDGEPQVRLVGSDGRSLPAPFRVTASGQLLRIWAAGLPGDEALGVVLGPGCAPRFAVRDARGAALACGGPYRAPPPAGLGPWLCDWRLAGPFALPAGGLRAIAWHDLPQPNRCLSGSADGLLEVRQPGPGTGWILLEHDLPNRPTRARMAIGCDGPFRAAVDEDEVLAIPEAFNAGLDGLAISPVVATAGRRLRILVDLLGGTTWGLIARQIQAVVP